MISNKISAFVCIMLSAAIIFSFGIAIYAKPQKSFSERENRALSSFPRISAEGIADGSFFSKLSDFYTDQFPIRDIFTAIKAGSEKTLLRRENNGVIFCKNGALIQKGETNTAILEANLAYLRAISPKINARICIVPRAIDVLYGELPTIYDTTIEKRAWELVDNTLEHRINITEKLKQGNDNGEYVWYSTDHHWTSDGAYIAYTEIADALAFSPYSTESFERVCVSEDFLGTSFSKSGLYSSSPDSITLYRFDGDDNFCVYNHEDQSSQNGLYAFKHLSKKDKYLVFLGGNYARLTISSKTNDRPKMLLIKDSFANSLIPFLVRHFELDIIDPRYYTGDLSEITKKETYDEILILIGLGTLESSNLKQPVF